jgi:hypothetical protein
MATTLARKQLQFPKSDAARQADTRSFGRGASNSFTRERQRSASHLAAYVETERSHTNDVVEDSKKAKAASGSSGH